MIYISSSEKWTPAALEMLDTLAHLEGEQQISYREIAEKMTERFGITFTKNACIGMGRRLRMPPRPSPLKKKRDGRMLVPKHVRIDAPIEPKEAWRPDEPQRLTIYQLRQGDCKWPLGDMMTRPPFLYCGQETKDGMSYCPEHCERAYNRPGKTWA